MSICLVPAFQSNFSFDVWLRTQGALSLHTSTAMLTNCIVHHCICTGGLSNLGIYLKNSYRDNIVMLSTSAASRCHIKRLKCLSDFSFVVMRETSLNQRRLRVVGKDPLPHLQCRAFQRARESMYHSTYVWMSR